MENKNRQDQDNKNPIPEVSNTKPMDSKREVEQSPDPKTDQDFPGYPHYPAKDDIMNRRNDIERENLDVENLPNSRNATGVSQRFPSDNTRNQGQNAGETQPVSDDSNVGGTATNSDETGVPQNVENDDLGMRSGTEADVSEEERRVLDDASYYRPTNDEDNLRQARLDNADFEGEPLNEESFGTVYSGVGLDVPGEVDETETEAMGQGDEENKYYSLGSDRQDQNEEDPYSGPVRDNDA